MDKLLLFAGPCVIENKDVPFQIAETIKSICVELDIDFVFKSSFRKANRTKKDSFTGIEKEQAFEILASIKNQLGLPIITDVHEVSDIKEVVSFADYLQIPAFLCRQTDLLVEAGKSGKWVNIKKGQFASPSSMQFAVEKVKSTGNQNVLLTERGTTFGYQDLVVDFRSVPKMKKFNVPVIVDCTHSLQQPNQEGGVTGGDPEMIETICNAAVAVGADGLFIEAHPNPSEALSDGANMLSLEKVKGILQRCKKIKESLK